jgi:hypothetical protein
MRRTSSPRPRTTHPYGSLNQLQRTALAILILLLAALGTVPQAQAHQLDQLVSIGGDGTEAGNAITIDAAGNRYLTGAFQSRASFRVSGEAVQLSSRGLDDVFVIKVRPDGRPAWARQIGGQVSNTGRGIALGANDTVYVTGDFNARATFSNAITRTSRGQNDAFLVQYDRDGTLRWMVQIGGISGDNSFGVAALGDDVVITGLFSSTTTFSNANGSAAAALTSAGANDIFVARYTSAGNLVWARQAGGTGNDAARAVAVDASGEIYLTGSFSTTATFSSPGVTQQASSAGRADVFVARYGPNGDLRWATRGGGTENDVGIGLALDANSNSYITGSFNTQASFGGQTLTGAGSQILLAKLNRDGQFQQTVQAGGAGVDEGRGIAVAPNGTVYITGRYQDDALFGTGANVRKLRQRDRSSFTNSGVFTAAYNPILQPIFLEGAGGKTNQIQSGNAIVTDAASNAHVTGGVFIRTNVGLGSDTQGQRTNGPSDAFLVTYATGTPREVFYFSSTTGGTIDGIGFADEDILAYDPANNKWSVLIDGSDLGLAGTDINAFEWVNETTLLMSFDTPITLPGIAGTVDDSDIVRFIPERLGPTTRGRFELFLDGGFVFTTGGNFVLSPALPGPFGDGAEAFRCTPFKLNNDLVCSVVPFFDGAAKGLLGESIDAFSVGESGVLGEIGEGDETEPGPDEDPPAAPDGVRIFLPALAR